VKAVNSGISVITFLKVVKFNTRFLGSRSPSITRKKVNTKSDLRVRISDEEEEGEEGRVSDRIDRCCSRSISCAQFCSIYLCI